MKIKRIVRDRDQRKKRVAAYCRVSTLLDEQGESLEAQINYYSQYIENNPDWEFSGVYSDEKTGTNAEKRPGFQQLINDALEDKIDYILVKSVSRFSRNTVDCQKYVNLLHNRGVDIYFEKERIDTANPSSSMMFAFMSAFAQNESKSISENLKWGIRERVRRGEYNLGNNRVLGYDCVDGKLIPNGDSVIIKSIFDMYLAGVSVTDIARSLKNSGISGRSGEPLTVSGVIYILSNEVYVGDKLLQKRAPKNMLTKQPDNRVPFESNYLYNDHEGIINRDQWEATQRKLIERRVMIEEASSASSASSSVRSVNTVRAVSSGSSSISSSVNAVNNAVNAVNAVGSANTKEGTVNNTGRSNAANNAGINNNGLSLHNFSGRTIRFGGRRHFLFGKIFCGYCGSPMTRRTIQAYNPIGAASAGCSAGCVHDASNSDKTFDKTSAGASEGKMAGNCEGKSAGKRNYRAWSCRDKRAGKKGHGCSMKNIKEDELLRAIMKKMQEHYKKKVAQTSVQAAQEASTASVQSTQSSAQAQVQSAVQTQSATSVLPTVRVSSSGSPITSGITSGLGGLEGSGLPAQELSTVVFPLEQFLHDVARVNVHKGGIEVIWKKDKTDNTRELGECKDKYKHEILLTHCYMPLVL